MLKFFRKQTTSEQAPPQAAAPVAPPEVAPDRPAAGAGTDPDRNKRRRGSRGGRNRRKPEGSAEGAATAVAAPPKPTRRPSERKPQPAKPARERSGATTRRRPAPRRAPLPAAKRELLVSVDVGEQRVAVLEDGRVAEVYLERPERRSIAGNVYKGTVDNVLPGMEAAFIEIGLEKNGFLFVDEIVGPELEGRRHGRKITDLISRGQELLVQSVKDPMKTKGARLTTDISLPGRFVVFVPQGEGLGVSRRLEDDERQRLKDIVKALQVKEGGVIVRTAAEGASAEDIERDLVFLQRLWKSIQAQAKAAKAPALVYQEAELPLRVIRDLFTGEFQKAYIDHERTHKRVVGYLKKTSPHMVERVIRYKEKEPLMEAYGVDAEIRSTLSRRVDLPSGGYLIFDYAEAFTVIDVNTGRYVGSRGKAGGGRLEDTITKNNLEAVKEVVRQLRLRDVGGIIVIDFIDMANPKNRATVEEAFRTELERDRTKTFVVEISPLGLVEMTRQNVTDGPREILTRKCPTCAGDGIVYSEASVAIDVERKLRELAAKPRGKAFKVELNARVASLIAGPGGSRVAELEAVTKRRFLLVGKPEVHLDHFALLAEGSLEELTPEAPVKEGATLEVKLVEVGLYDPAAAVAKLDGYAIVVAGAAKLVGKKAQARIERALDGVAYATVVQQGKRAEPKPPLTAEAEAEKPTRQPRAKKADETGEPEAEAALPEEPSAGAEVDVDVDVAEPTLEEDAETEDEAAETADADATTPAKKRRRRGSRGGRGRKKPVPAAGESVTETGEPEAAQPTDEPAASPQPGAASPRSAPRIHVPDRDVDPDEADEPDEVAGEAGSENGKDPAAAARKRRRRGSRGGRNRRRKPAATNGAAPAGEPAAAVADETESG